MTFRAAYGSTGGCSSSSDVAMDEVVIRPLASHDERRACVALQEATWGDGFVDRVPSSILMIAGETGGIASGAFDGGRLVGFVFGISGFRGGLRVHWSDMLAVLPEYRNRGIGRLLKLHQRQRLLDHGVEVMYWTFDPLVARNAYLNLRRLGAIVRIYDRDLYGRSNSPLHHGIGTDRLRPEWWLASEHVERSLADDRPAPDPGAERLLLNPTGTAGPDAAPRPGDRLAAPAGDTLEIAIPADIQTLKDRDLELAREWRTNVRAAFEAALAAGYAAVDFLRGDVVARYILERRSGPGGRGS
jgi:predicted GNAT superfamily acetyltransferase